MTTDRPTSAGKWEWQPRSADDNLHAFSIWIWHPSNQIKIPVEVTENPTSGRMCRELRMGGSQQCGFQPWSGIWRKAA